MTEHIRNESPRVYDAGYSAGFRAGLRQGIEQAEDEKGNK